MGQTFKAPINQGHAFQDSSVGAVRVKDSSTGAACTYHPMDGEKPSLS
ncbi:hypothetical protein A2U01_0080065, partial [Trifolium medium]|nr:hypothetical protein [Trifolium medium]